MILFNIYKNGEEIMNLQLLKNAVTSKVVRKALVVKKNSPVIMFVGGTVGMVGTAVLASRATLKLEVVIEDMEKKRILITQDKASYKLAMNDIHVLKIQTLVKIGKLYAPAICLGVLSIGALTGAHVTLTKRNTAIMAAYATLDRGYKEYRQRVRDEYGDEAERKIRYNGQTGNYVVEGEDGKKVKTPVSRSRLEGPYSEYARLWSEDTTNSYNAFPEYNLAFLTSKQNWLNDRLRARGHVFLNEAYDELGLERSKAGAVVGWLLDGGNSDNYIDFGIFTTTGEGVLNFITGIDGGIWLDFNVDGVIYDKI